MNGWRHATECVTQCPVSTQNIYQVSGATISETPKSEMFRLRTSKFEPVRNLGFITITAMIHKLLVIPVKASKAYTQMMRLVTVFENMNSSSRNSSSFVAAIDWLILDKIMVKLDDNAKGFIAMTTRVETQ